MYNCINFKQARVTTFNSVAFSYQETVYSQYFLQNICNLIIFNEMLTLTERWQQRH